MTMNRAIYTLCAFTLLCTACESERQAERATGGTVEKADATLRTSEVKSPVEISYRVIGTPIVGAPVALDLQFKSAMGTTPYKVTYRVNDSSALQMAEAQSEEVSIAPSRAEESIAQQVTVVPLREGRLYLNVAAIVATESGSMRSVTAVPIQVGPAAPREILENGTVETDADGNLIRTLPAREDPR